MTGSSSTKVCEWCHQEFVPKKGKWDQQKFCCARCRQDNYNAYNKTPERREYLREYEKQHRKLQRQRTMKVRPQRHCKFCGALFTPKRTNQEYCDHRCKVNNYNRRYRERN